ncbi:essential for mitotic growth 1 [Angomonas deanei]|nr:essential for mitotic growth 1 [Angomonas deanei]|eukprot:EPY41512.1 essential for mitotic growth 1 [Angomonas deanei]
MVDPRLRVPRHVKVFEKMMVQLLFKMRVRSTSGYLTLLKEIKNPVTDHIPANTELIRVEKDGDLINMFDFAQQLSVRTNSIDGATSGSSAAPTGVAGSAAFSSSKRQQLEKERKFKPFAFIVGGMSTGDVTVDYADKEKVQSIKLAEHGMSAAAALSLILHSFEECWLREDNENEDI